MPPSDENSPEKTAFNEIAEAPDMTIAELIQLSNLGHRY